MVNKYLIWQEKITNDFSESNLNSLYEQGFVFTRLSLGQMIQTRSVRVNLKYFSLSSENKRILKKTENLNLNPISLPHKNYDWKIHKLGYDFYSTKFGEKTFSANKIKQLLTEKNNFNLLLEYSLSEEKIGYCICFENNDWLHYAYPFYDLAIPLNNLGIGMMTKAIILAQEMGKKYVCLGSAQDVKSAYKLQFKGVEWYNGTNWNNNPNELKKLLKKESI